MAEQFSNHNNKAPHSSVKKYRITPRQKMINLMYIVLMAMLALNVSPDVLNGFSLVEHSLNRSTANSTKQNATLYSNFDEQMKSNPAKVKEWYDKAIAVKRMSDSLFNYAQDLKIAIVKEADGKDGDINNIQNKDDLEAANQVMLAPSRGQGQKLFNNIVSFREKILKYVDDPTERNIISSNFNTDIPKEKQTEINYIQRESKKMFNRANLMLTAYSREIKRTEILEGLFLGHNIITFNYCFEKIINSLNEDLDINFAKRLFKGMIRPDVVIYHNCEKNLDDIFHEYKMINNYKNDRENIIEKYEDEIIELYKNTLDYYNSWCSEHKKNYFPQSIGEDLFIDF